MDRRNHADPGFWAVSRVSVENRTIEEEAWRLRKAASLVKLLALSPSHRLHREQVMEALWPDLGTDAASNNLRQALHGAREHLEPDRAANSRYLDLQEQQLTLCPRERLWVDAEAFEEAAATARRARDPALTGWPSSCTRGTPAGGSLRGVGGRQARRVEATVSRAASRACRPLRRTRRARGRGRGVAKGRDRRPYSRGGARRPDAAVRPLRQADTSPGSVRTAAEGLF